MMLVSRDVFEREDGGLGSRRVEFEEVGVHDFCEVCVIDCIKKLSASAVTSHVAYRLKMYIVV